jgi:hypothetical protein
VTTPLQRIVAKVADAIAGTWQEGADPPPRFVQQSEDFANRNPSATRRQWADFAARLAGEAYRAGFRRGYEHVERDPEPAFKALPPELIADHEDPEWRHPSRRIVAPDLSNPLDEVTDAEVEIDVDLEAMAANEEHR